MSNITVITLNVFVKRARGCCVYVFLVSIRYLTFVPFHFAGVGEWTRHQPRRIISPSDSWDVLSRSPKQTSF